MTAVPDQRLLDLIRDHSYTPHHKILTCAHDVERELKKRALKVGYDPLDPDGIRLLALMGIDIVIAGDSAPGTWQLVRHDHCKVTWRYQGRPGYDGGCGAESAPQRHWNAVCTLDFDHPESHESWGASGTGPVASWGGLIPHSVSHQDCTILATSHETVSTGG
jgi:hypothetical protein